MTASAPTAGDGFDDPPLPGVTWTPGAVAEMAPGPLPPLLWTINGPLLDDAFRWLYGELGIDIEAPRLVARYRGQAVVNLSAVVRAARQCPAARQLRPCVNTSISSEFEGHAGADEIDDAQLPEVDGWRPWFGARWRAAILALRLRRRLVDKAAAFVEAVDLLTESPMELDALDVPAIVEYRHRVRDLARVGMRTQVGIAAAAAAFYRALELLLRRWLGDSEVGSVVQRLTAGAIGGEASGGAVLGVDEIADDDTLSDVVADVDVENIADRLSEEGGSVARLVHRVEEQARKAGSAAIYGGWAWEERPDELWAMVGENVRPDRPAESASVASTDAARALRQLLAQLTTTWRWRVTRVLTGQLIDVRRRLVVRLVADTREFLRLREATKSSLLRLGGLERRAARALATSLGDALAGDDLEMCADGELDALALGDDELDKDELSRRREAFERMEHAAPLPILFTGPPPHDDGADDAPGTLRGRPSSPGSAAGPARVARTRADAAGIKPGEILVGRSSDPSWTPLFRRAAGIVMEQGGPLSHASIVARELSLPAVLGVRNALADIPAGAMVRVDGDSGTVEMADDTGEAESQAS